jgi:hypothetical protein
MEESRRFFYEDAKSEILSEWHTVVAFQDSLTARVEFAAYLNV